MECLINKKNKKEIIKSILSEEFSKVNNITYLIVISSKLKIVIKSKKINQSLIDYSYFVQGGIDSKYVFDFIQAHYFFITYDVWKKMEYIINNYWDIQSILLDIISEDEGLVIDNNDKIKIDKESVYNFNMANHPTRGCKRRLKSI